MNSTELATRILLTVLIVGAHSINYCKASDEENHSLKPKEDNAVEEQFSSSLDTPSSPDAKTRSFKPSDDEPNTRLFADSSEEGILLPYEEDFPQPGGNGAREFPTNSDSLPSSVSFQAKPLSLRVSNGKSLKYPGSSYSSMYEKNNEKSSQEEKKSTYFLRNNCFGPRCVKSKKDQSVGDSVEDWKTVYYNNKEVKAKKYDDYSFDPGRRLEDNVMESMSSNFHAQLAVPFVVVDDGRNALKGQQSFSRRTGLADRFSRMTTSTSTSSPGWIKLKPISPDAYDPFHFSRNFTARDSEKPRNTFSKRDSSNVVNFSKRAGVELNPESFADRWGWSGNNDNYNNNNNNRGGGSRLPAWLEDQLKFGGNRNSDQDKNWVKLDPIPVAGVTISKWVPKGTPTHELPTTSWQANRDRPNAGTAWWDRIDDNRILNGGRPAFLRPGVDDKYNPPQSSISMSGWGGSKGSSLSSLDRYPTNSWNDIIYPEGPVSATASWQQNKGISSQPSSFSVGGSGGWPSDTRKQVVTGSWSAPPQTNRLPSYINRFNDNHRLSNYPSKQVNEDDPRWVLISNTRRVASANGNEQNKILSYINRLHPDIDRTSDFPFYEPSARPHRHGKDLWPFQGTPTVPASPSQDEAFHRVNATLSTLTPVLVHRGGTTLRPPIVHTIRPGTVGASGAGSFFGSSTASPILSTYLGDGRATSSNADLLQSSTTTPVRRIPGRIRQGLKNINPVYAAVGAGMIPATLAAVMPMVLGRRKRRDISQNNNTNPLLYYLTHARNSSLTKYDDINNRLITIEQLVRL